MLKISLIVIGFISGLLFCLSYNTKDLVEGFDNAIKMDCPNILVQKGMKIELTNTRKAKVPGVNPIYFDNLDEYTEFIKWQKANGINCPILAFKETIGANGENMFSISKELSSGEGVVMPKNLSYSSRLHPLYDANSDDPPFNQGPQSGFDEEDQNIGRYTTLDKNGGLGMFSKSYKKQGGDPYGNYDGVVTQKIVEEMTNRGETMDQRICLDAVRPQLGEGLNRAFEPYQRNNLGKSGNNLGNNEHHVQITGLIQAVNKLSSNTGDTPDAADDGADDVQPGNNDAFNNCEEEASNGSASQQSVDRIDVDERPSGCFKDARDGKDKWYYNNKQDSGTKCASKIDGSIEGKFPCFPYDRNLNADETSVVIPEDAK